ncbi:hypothetical protein ABE021_11300 [Sporosarcina gallistercoris]|uniref:hypothetical protein n=1 Tax=Sporosarcina gallistercoris TaxID=2762245 RepID=UPI003D272693
MLVDINLLPEKEKERSGLLYAALAFIGAALLFWLIFFFLTRSMTSDTERLDNQLVKLQETQSELSGQLDRSDTAQSHDQLAASVKWVEDYRYETAPLLEDLVAQLPRRGFFRSLAFAAPHQATVEIQFDDKTEAAYYLTRIMSSDLVETASIESIEAEEIDQEEGVVSNWLPRYLATYTIFFTDGRQVIDGAAPPLPEETVENNETTEPPANDADSNESTVPEEEGSDAESN